MVPGESGEVRRVQIVNFRLQIGVSTLDFIFTAGRNWEDFKFEPELK